MMTEAQIEARVEAMIEALDRRYAETHMTRESYETKLRAIDVWAARAVLQKEQVA